MSPEQTGEYIATMRKNKGLTQRQLAEKLNVSDKAVSRWETGKGYPDVTSLVALASFFDVSINELLCGKKLENDEVKAVADTTVTTVLKQSEVSRRKSNRIIIMLAVFSALLVLMTVILSMSFVAFLQEIKGSEDCVISENYDYITYCGQRYIPFETENLYCNMGEVLIKEAAVENAPILGKLLFGDTVYAVEGCSSNDLIYLMTDYDLIKTNVYCLETKYNYYKSVAADITTPTPNYYFEFWGEESPKPKRVNADTDFLDLIESKNGLEVLSDFNYDFSRGDGDEQIKVTAENDGVFFFDLGEILYENGNIYWVEYGDGYDTHNFLDENEAYFTVYKIPEEYYSRLNQYKSYMLS